MTFDAFFAAAVSPLDPFTVALTLATGSLTGSAVLWQFPRMHTAGTDYLFAITFSMGVLFFMARLMSLYFTASPLWPRNIGFSILWLGYTLCIVGGVRFRQKFWP